MTDGVGERALDNQVRPTLRCLLEDLGSEVGGDELRAALRTAAADLAADQLFQFPVSLNDISHPILDRANLIAGDPAAERERIKTIRDRRVIKVKVGPRRGALWQNEADGQWWLLAVGRRKDDGGGDFYLELETHYSKDSTPIAPTQRDTDYRRVEDAYRKDGQEEREIHKMVLQALLDAAREPGRAVEVDVFGAKVTIRVVPDEPDVAVLEATWSMQTFDDQDRLPDDLLAMLPASKSVEDWAYLAPPPDSDMDQMWWTYVAQRWIDDLAVAAELDALIDPFAHAHVNLPRGAR